MTAALVVLLLVSTVVAVVAYVMRFRAAIARNTVGKFCVRHLRTRPQVELLTDLEGLHRVVLLVHYIGGVLRSASAQDSATLVRELASCLGAEGMEPPRFRYVYSACRPMLSSEVTGRLYKLNRYGIDLDDGGFRGLGEAATGGCGCVVRHELVTLPGADASILRACILQIVTCMTEQGRSGVRDAVNGSEYLIRKFEEHRERAIKTAGWGEAEMNEFLKKSGLNN
jgi:hypothetical protein